MGPTALHHVGSRDQIQVSRHNAKHLYTPSHVAGSPPCFWRQGLSLASLTGLRVSHQPEGLSLVCRSLTGLELTSWLASKPLGSSCVFLPSVGIMSYSKHGFVGHSLE